MFTLCTNGTCPRAGWCKRFTYSSKLTDAERDKWASCFFTCEPSSNWFAYKRNKAREIYERENPNASFEYEQPNTKKYPNNNRESGVRENNETNIGVAEAILERDTSRRNSVLQLQRSGDRRSDTESTMFFAEDIQYINQLISDHFDRLTRNYTRFNANNQD